MLRFRGRALYPVDDYDNQRTVICEGELCFFQDAIARPYLYEEDPAAIFANLVQTYNSQVEAFKRFKLGDVTVTDPNNYVRLESEDAEPVLSVINKLLERCGGYIVFTTDPKDGQRVVHWLASVGRRSGQAIEAGENLFELSRSGANTELATALLPYGAKDEATGMRITIASVNGGRDYITDAAAVAIRGTIMQTVTWDDVTEPSILLQKARQQLDESKLVVTSLTLTALDLSYIDKTVDSYELGDYIRLVSRAHGLNEEFQLTEQTEDLLNPGNDLINLGKEIRTLTRMDVAGDGKSMNAVKQAKSSIKNDFTPDVKQAVDTALANTVPDIRAQRLQVLGEAYLAKPAVTTDESQRTASETLPEAYEAVLDNLTPVRFKYSGETPGVYHAGFRAQDVRAALTAAGLTASDFGGLNGTGTELGLAYTEFIALLLQKIKRQEQRITALENAAK
jgi:phage minor structural protein